MSVQTTIENKLTDQLAPSVLDVINESYQHAGHQHAATDSHFKVIVVSNAFEGLRKVARHRKIYQILADELIDPVHALVIQEYTPIEWQQKSESAQSQ